MKSSKRTIIHFIGVNHEIPPKGYGAVEDVIWNYKVFLQKAGYDVFILNTRNVFLLLKETVFVRNRIIHFHSEPYMVLSYICNKIFFRNNTILWTCHNGYILTGNESFFYKIIAFVISRLSDSVMISISPLMEAYFLRKGFQGKHFILQNGIDTLKFKNISLPTKDILYLGNINQNKGQDLLLSYYHGNIKIDFVGPYIDSAIDIKGNNYLGIWKKEEVYQKLGEYKLLILLTHSEGDPLVVKEALSAGCSILTSKMGSINLSSEPFIKVIDIYQKEDLEIIDSAIHTLLQENISYRSQIRAYAQRFDWSNIIKEYINILENI